MKSTYERIEESAGHILSIIKSKVSHGIVLGTDLGEFENGIKNQIAIPYYEIPYFPASTVKSHRKF